VGTAFKEPHDDTCIHSPLPLYNARIVCPGDLVAPASQHRAAILGEHSGEEAMRFGIAGFALKQPFRETVPWAPTSRFQTGADGWAIGIRLDQDARRRVRRVLALRDDPELMGRRPTTTLFPMRIYYWWGFSPERIAVPAP
jgi:hypothetical protein